MSFLTPLYALGLAALAAPIVFHLIRRSPRGQVPFSSLIYLTPTLPRLTRWSRLDNLLLLFLRAAALFLLVVAFTRPFLREPAHTGGGDGVPERIALLMDTSASMRRGKIFAQAKQIARELITACRPTDEIGVFSFDGSSRVLVGFEESRALDPARRRAVAQAQVDRLEPTWAATNLGGALIDVVAAINDVADRSEKAGRMPRRVVVISDLQQGASLDALGDFEWPSDVELDLRPISEGGSNAGLQILAAAAEGQELEGGPQRRVRISNDAGSHVEEFEVHWVDERGVAVDRPIPVYVPPGESRVVRVPRPPKAATNRSLRLTGDTHEFDNIIYFADDRREEATVLYVGSDKVDDPSGLLYYVERVYGDTAERSIQIVSQPPGAEIRWVPQHAPALVILGTETTPENRRKLQEYAQGGGTLLYVSVAPGRADTLSALARVSPWNVEDAVVTRDVMLGEISFEHPLFASLAGAQFNDFTKIHFWKYRRYSASALGEARVLARFENGDPAVLEKPLGKGRLIVLASGWQPADSQLARSSKFVPVMSALVEGRDPRQRTATNHLVGERVVLAASSDLAKGFVIRKPDGTTVKVPAQNAVFAETDEPGVYTVESPDGARSFAVNLDPVESKTAPLHVETLEQLGCRLVNHSQKNVDQQRLRQMHNAELEERQKLWRFLILAVIGVLIVETWLAGRTREAHAAAAEAVTT